MEYPFKDLMPLDEATAREGYYRDWTHIDADTFHQISELAKFIREKGNGADTREAIAQALERVYHDAAISGNANMEVSQARGSYSTLAERLMNLDKVDRGNLNQLMVLLAGRIKKGQVTMADLTQEVKEALTGGAVAVVGENAVGTVNLINDAVTYEKTSFGDEIAIRVENIQKNGNFTDENGDGTAEFWYTGASATGNRVEGGFQFWTPSATSTSGALVSNSTGWSVLPVPGHKYYISLEKTNVGLLRILRSAGEVYNDFDVKDKDKISMIYTPTTNYRFEFRLHPETINMESSVGNLMVVDLTKTFGSGNEPDIDYFEFLLSLVGVDGWFGGEINLMDARKNGILSAKDLKLYDASGVLDADNVEDALVDLADDRADMIGKIDSLETKGLQIRSGKNLLNPDKFIPGRIYAEEGKPLTVSGEGYITQKIELVKGKPISFVGVRIYMVTDKDNVSLASGFPNSESMTILAEDLPEATRYLWVSIYPTEKFAQVEYNSSSTAYEPYKPIEGIYAGDIKILDYPIRISDDKKKELHDLALSNGAVRDLIEKNDFLKLNSTYNFKNDSLTKVPESVTVDLKGADEQKVILHLHKRENDGFDTVNDVYLPNAEDDFSDVQIKNDSGEVLPYRVLYYSDQLDIVADSRLGRNHNTSMIYKNSFGDWLTTHRGDLKKSSDEGKTWTALTAFAGMRNARLTLIAQDDTMYFSYDGNLYRSQYPYTDYTIVFDLKSRYADSLVQTTGMVQHPDGEIFFGNYQVENHILIYRSADNGLTWEEVYNVEGKYKHVHALYIDEHQNPPALYAGLDRGVGDYASGVLKTTDKGETWTDLRQQHPNMPTATDFGVIYSDPSGYRLLGGETATGGGYSVIKTTDDVNFRPVLGVGTGVLKVVKKDGKLFGGGSGWLSHKYGTIVMSEDDGETWKQIYTTSPMTDSNGTNDGFRYMSDLGNQIIGGMQSTSRPPVRIFSEGIYAEIVVDVPAGTNHLVVETGKSYANIAPVNNDTITAGDYLVNFSLSEGGEVIKEEVSGNYYAGDFEWAENGKRLSYFYPEIYAPSENQSVLVKSLDGFDVDSTAFDVSDGITISFWGDLAIEDVDINLFETDLGDVFKLDRSASGTRTTLNGLYKIQPIARFFPEAVLKFDLVIDALGETSVYNNGLKVATRHYNSLDVLTAIANSSSLKLLRNISGNSVGSMQHFSVRKGVIPEQQLHEEFNSYVTDNYM